MTEANSSTYLETTIEGQKLRFPLAPGSICRIGRNPDSEVVLPAGSASRNHAILQHTDLGKLYLTDLGSRNGTFLNGRRITAPVVLQRGDIITIGDQEFVFHRNGTSPKTAGAALPEVNATMVTFKMQLITVLVADIRDYTGLSRRLGESRISQVIGVFMQEAGAALQRHGSWAQKYIGDAVMAVWVHRNHYAERQEMLTVLQALAKLEGIVEGLQARFGLDAPVRIGVGINTGLAATGNMGSNVLADYTALGDVVNKTFRLESATKEIGCDIVLGQATYQVIASAREAAGIPKPQTARLKGYEDPEQVFTLKRSALPRLYRAASGAAKASEVSA